METSKILQSCMRTYATRSAIRPNASQSATAIIFRATANGRPRTSCLHNALPSRSRSFSVASRRLGPSASSPSEPSTEKDASDPAKTSTTEEGAANTASEPKVDPAVAELEVKKREVVDLTDKWKRSIADYRNLQEQTKREVSKARDFAIERFARDLIDSVDNLERALGTIDPASLSTDSTSASPSSPSDSSTTDASSDALVKARQDLKNLYEGLKMTNRILLSALKKHGLERFDPSEPVSSDGNNGGGSDTAGKTAVKFDPNRHEATFQAPQKDKEDGTVFYCQSKGFALNGRVLRAAKVGVVKNS